MRTILFVLIVFSTFEVSGQSNQLPPGSIGYFLTNAFKKAIDKKYNEAIIICDSALAIDSNNDNIYDAKANYLWMSGLFNQAAANLEKAITLDKDSSYLFRVFVWLGILYEKAGKMEDAQSNYEKAVYLFENVKRKNDKYFEVSNRIDYVIALLLSGNFEKWNKIKDDRLYSGWRDRYEGKSHSEILEIYWKSPEGGGYESK